MGQVFNGPFKKGSIAMQGLTVRGVSFLPTPSGQVRRNHR